MNILFITALVPLILALVSFAVPPAMFSDSAFGFLVFQGMEEGAGFNMNRMPDLENISKDRDKFMTWWSPGQYLVPGIFLVLGCNHGWAIVLAVLLCSWMGLWGWMTVAQKAGAGKWTQILFLLGLVTFRHGTLPFRIYNGGEILLFAVAPWGFLLLQRSLTGGFWSGFIAALGSAMLLFFAKLTGLIVFAVSGVSLVALDLWQKRMVRPPVVGLFAGAVLAALIVGWGWMSRGGTPMVSESAPEGMEAFLFPPAAAVFSGFSLHEFLARLLIHPDRAVLPGKDVGVTSWILGPAALVSLVWIWQKLRRDPTSRAWIALVGPLVVVQSFLFVVLYGKGSAVSMDER
ncbi:MAG: hypothetical protein EBS01_07450, partial [Verrucomicrobia bacterium]|nr:hypothetical protein [Verrucomicrobiota bacterium]